MQKTHLINYYDNKIDSNTIYSGELDSNKKAIKDIDWNQLIQDWIILLGDFNAYSPIWNPLISIKTNAESLKEIIEKYDLILNNELGVITRPNTRKNQFIINLIFISITLELLNS